MDSRRLVFGLRSKLRRVESIRPTIGFHSAGGVRFTLAGRLRAESAPRSESAALKSDEVFDATLPQCASTSSFSPSGRISVSRHGAGDVQISAA
ncbi:hypothetical protein EYF80_053919 [Liparis tanakae]|uniref:Uncharacterized protein n=1 Tax=Liparis tanakae TaxID=230148 RepID=A0A4Z2F620_9TELE|nr:hypothetical protein EYF80_053919 [Liparis tanakae]